MKVAGVRYLYDHHHAIADGGKRNAGSQIKLRKRLLRFGDSF